VSHVAKAVRKRIDKEHEDFADATVGGEHTPGYCKVLKHVDGTADVSGAKDATLFQNNGIVHSAGNQTLWCITGAASDPTVLLMDPDKQYKGGDITWTGAAQFDASVDMTIVHIDASLTVSGATVLDGSTNIHGPADMSDTQIDGTLTVLDRADFSSMGVSGDVTFSGGVEFDGAVKIDGSIEVAGLMSFCANNVYDSSWFECEARTSYSKTHDLSSTAMIHWVWFRDTYNQLGEGANRIYDAAAYHTGTAERGAQVQNLTTTAMVVYAGYYPGYCFTATNIVANCTSGHYRVIAMRLV
jgi:hypothetical protein